MKGFVYRLHQSHHSPAVPHVGVFSFSARFVGRMDFDVAAMFVLASLIQFGCGGTFYREASVGAKFGKFGMSALVSFGTSAAYFSSVTTPFSGIVG